MAGHQRGQAMLLVTMAEAWPVQATLLASTSKSYCVQGARPDTVRLNRALRCPRPANQCDPIVHQKAAHRAAERQALADRDCAHP
jgi:hypothetical protein